MLAGVNRVIVFVGDVERCASFYRDMFQLEVVPNKHVSSEWMELDAGGCRLAFHQAYGPDGPIASPTGSPRNPHKIVFYAEDVTAMRDLLVRKGAQMNEIETFGDISLCDGQDPEGHRFQISNR